jgi:hypothetical protein
VSHAGRSTHQVVKSEERQMPVQGFSNVHSANFELVDLISRLPD